MKTICIGLMAGALGCVLTVEFSAAASAHTREKIIYSFKGGADGGYPAASLVDVKGVLYGTTAGGGAIPDTSNHSIGGRGVVFSLNPKTGAESVIYSFCGQAGCRDGAGPYAGLIAVKGTLYGTTLEGGASGTGVVFALDPATGKETVLHAFGGSGDGGSPSAGVIDVNGALYGTTIRGGAYDCGTVFAIDLKTGKETMLYSFGSHVADGTSPGAGLIDVNGTLYGTTAYGGKINGGGTVFAFDPATGAETVLHSFLGADGLNPTAGLIDVNGILYGTTDYGGQYYDGTVFTFDPASRAETVLYSFRGTSDGENPTAGLISEKGWVYGTTGGDLDLYAFGTVFAVRANTGAIKVLHSFFEPPDGLEPAAGLIAIKNKLYGTTSQGGANGWGTVFVIDSLDQRGRFAGALTAPPACRKRCATHR